MNTTAPISADAVALTKLYEGVGVEDQQLVRDLVQFIDFHHNVVSALALSGRLFLGSRKAEGLAGLRAAHALVGYYRASQGMTPEMLAQVGKLVAKKLAAIPRPRR